MTTRETESVLETIKTEVLVIGGGLAGLSAALEAKRVGREVLLVCKRRPGRSGNSLLAATNISTVFPQAGDSVENFVRDTLNGGRGIGDPALVRTLAENAEQTIDFLRHCGVQFLGEKGGLPRLRLVPGHGQPRTACCMAGNFPTQVKGQALSLPLLGAVEQAGIRLLEWTTVVRLIRHGERVSGAWALDRNGNLLRIVAGSVVLACGGGGRLYSASNNTREMTGDGLALAWEAGAELRDLEFVQFHPAMGIAPLKMIIPTTLFGDGALLRNCRGDAFLRNYVAGDERDTGRDDMGRAIYAEVLAGRGVNGGVYLDLAPIPPELADSHYADLWQLLERRGCDPTQQPIIVGLAVHFLMGGMVIDANCCSTVSGLFAAGEVTGGVHGANRLGGNALLEAVVFGRIAGQQAAQEVSGGKDDGPAPPWLPTGAGERLPQLNRELGCLLWEYAGVIRNGVELERGLALWQVLAEQFRACGAAGQPHLWWETHNKLAVSQLILQAAEQRKESRGAHFRSDFPEPDDRRWCGSLRVSRQEGGEPLFRFVPQNPQGAI